MTDTSTTGAADVRWDLSDLYSGLDDPALSADLDRVVTAADAFAADLRGRVGGLDAAELAAAVERLEGVVELLERSASYAHLRFAADTSDAAVGALVARTDEIASAVQSAVLFFELEWNAVDDARAEELLGDDALATYAHHLRVARAMRPHQLSEPEEKVIAELGPTGPAAWSRLFDQVTSAIAVTVDDEPVSLDEALNELHTTDRARRLHAAGAVTEALERDVATRAYIFNTLLADKATRDRLRGHPHWVHSRNLANEADDEQVEALVSAVTSRYELVGRYYDLKRRLLGADELTDIDRYAPLPLPGDEDEVIGWAEAQRIVLDAYGAFSPRLADIAAEFFDKGWIDAPPSKGKRGGAFAAHVSVDVHPYVFLNYGGTQRDVMTLAHELGHGVHMRLSQVQTGFNAPTPLTTAETASIFGEALTFSRLLSQLDDPRKRLALICTRLEDGFATVFRQISMNRFEEAVHTHRREQGELSVDDFAAHWTATQEAMFGDSVTLTEGYRRVWWSYIPHFIAVPGYVYAYAFGHLLALALYRLGGDDPASFAPQYLDLLSAGGSVDPVTLLKRVDVDLSDPGFWAAGLDVIAEEVAEAEALADEIGA